MKQTISPAVRRKNERIEGVVAPHRTAKSTLKPIPKDTLRIIPLGGQNGIGEKNMIVVEYNNDAIVLDCGFALGIDLPGVNYAIPAVQYLESIRHKLRGYIISHGHMDHIGALIHTVPNNPAPIIGSRFTIGMVNAQFEKAADKGTAYQPEQIVLDMDTHQTLSLGVFTIELIRVTHAIPESSAISVQTPAGRIINTGDFRLDPEPLDARPSDVERLRQMGDDGVLLLMSESTNATKLGRTPTEHTLQDSFYELIDSVTGRLFIAVFSTNMNRVQMIINAAHASGRKVALDGRSMMATAELAVRLGTLKVPKGTLMSIREAATISDDKLIVICTGGQGEPGAAMTRMAAGTHQYFKLKAGDAVVISSTPIVGNERSYQTIGDDLARIGVKQFRHPTHQIDGCGPLHVSGHGNRDEHAEMIQLTRPQYLMPIYGGALNRAYHRDIGLEHGIPSDNILMAENGQVIELSTRKAARIAGRVTAGSVLVDQTGSIVSELVVKDRLSLQDDGFVTCMAVIHRKTGRLASSPDIITRGTIAIRDNGELMDQLRLQVKAIFRGRAVNSLTVDNAKAQLKRVVEKHITKQTGLTPIVIPVVTIISPNGATNHIPKPMADTCLQ